MRGRENQTRLGGGAYGTPRKFGCTVVAGCE